MTTFKKNNAPDTGKRFFFNTFAAAMFLCVTFFTITATHVLAGNCNPTIVNRDNKKIRLSVEIADTESTRQRGLMYRRILDDNEGMLFVFDKSRILNFWMKNTYIPLSIAYIGNDGVIQEIYDMKPLDISVTYPSAKPARYALEMKQGWFEKNNIHEGCRIDLNGCIGK